MKGMVATEAQAKQPSVTRQRIHCRCGHSKGQWPGCQGYDMVSSRCT